jgi:hypothetical protein
MGKFMDFHSIDTQNGHNIYDEQTGHIITAFCFSLSGFKRTTEGTGSSILIACVRGETSKMNESVF